MAAAVTPIRTEAEKAFVAAFEATKTRLPGSPAVARARDEAMGAFRSSGLPHRRIEAWHYTDLRAIMDSAPPVAAPPSEGLAREVATLSPVAGAIRLACVDGVALQPPGGLPEGVLVRTLSSVLAEGAPADIAALAPERLGAGDAALVLNGAFMQDGFVVDVDPGLVLERPIELFIAASGDREAMVSTRCLVRLGKGARASLVEHHMARGPAALTRNSCLVLALAEDARLDHVALFERETPGSINVASVLTILGARADLASFAMVEGGGTLRRQVFQRFEGGHARAELSGLALLKGEDHADTTLVIDHVATHCVSREFFKHVVDGAATGVYQGKVVVAPGAQKTDGGMKSQAILLSDGAAMYNKPELEIFADDVVCGHGATCGALDEDQLFYARARGLPRAEAEALLIEAFAGEAVERVRDEAIREMLVARARRWLDNRRAGGDTRS